MFFFSLLHIFFKFYRSCSNLTRPPSYDTVIGGPQPTLQIVSDHDINMNIGESSTIENPPPSYEEAVLLINQNRNEFVVET